MTLAVNLANLVDGLGADGTITDAKSISDKPNSSTGYFDLPSGTTGQRPGSPTTGMVRHNSSLGLIETWNGTAWTGLGGSATVSGTAPASPTEGAFWLNSETGDLYTYGPGGWVLAGAVPSFAAVATSGSYTDLVNKPTTFPPAAVSDQANTSTGYFGMPIGTTAQRPVNPAAGFTRINTTTDAIEVYYKNAWNNVNYIGALSATGGTVSYSAGYKIHTFLTSGPFTVTDSPAAGAAIEYLVVGGGGGGGYSLAGGGGGGAVIYNAARTITPGVYNVVIGAGGTNCTTGLTTTFYNETATGGGGSANRQSGAIASLPQGGANGGGGTGDGNSNASAVTGAQGVAPTGQPGSLVYAGFKGGNGGSGGPNYAGGGGAGANGNGANQAGTGGAGGPGKQIDINGFGNYYYGGGGGGTHYTNGGVAGNGGLGGGGSASISAGTVGSGGAGGINPGGTGSNGNGNTLANLTGGAGGANTGGGGGSGSHQDGPGGTGGSGIIVIRYRYI